MKRAATVIDLGLYRLRKLAHAGRNRDLFSAVAREQRLRQGATDRTRELMRRACARAAEKAALEDRRTHYGAILDGITCDCTQCRNGVNR